jgi:hypothetical protein
MRPTCLAGLFALTLAAGASAAPLPVTTPPQADGPMTAVFAFADTVDHLRLLWDQPFDLLPPQPLFDTLADPPAAVVAGFGGAGPVTLILENLTQGYSFTAGTPDLGVQHFVQSDDFTDFGVGPLAAATAAAIAAAGPGGLFLGVEDRRGGDDFNDFIFYLRPLAVPVPAAFGLFGLGALALAVAARAGARRTLAQRAD